MRQTWTMSSELKVLIDSEKFRVIVFQYSVKNNNLELEIFTSKHDPICKSKFLVITWSPQCREQKILLSSSSFFPVNKSNLHEKG